MSLKYYTEKLLDGALNVKNSQTPEQNKQYNLIDDWDEKFMVREIESNSEFQGIEDGARGIIYNGKLYMCQKNSWHALHLNIITFLQKVHKIKIPVDPLDYPLDDLNTIKDLLTVQKWEGKIFVGESYNHSLDGILKDISKSTIGKNLKKHFSVLDKLKIPYKMERM